MSKYILTTYNVLTEQVKVYYVDKVKITSAKIWTWKNDKFKSFEREIFQYSLIEVEDYNTHTKGVAWYEN